MMLIITSTGHQARPEGWVGGKLPRAPRRTFRGPRRRPEIQEI